MALLPTLMPGRYDLILLEAAQLLEPELQKVTLPARTLKTQADVDAGGLPPTTV